MALRPAGVDTFLEFQDPRQANRQALIKKATIANPNLTEEERVSLIEERAGKTVNKKTIDQSTVKTALKNKYIVVFNIVFIF